MTRTIAPLVLAAPLVILWLVSPAHAEVAVPAQARGQVSFNVEGADLTELVEVISRLTGRRFILPVSPRSFEASIIAPETVTPEEAYQAFLSVLEMNGLTVVPAGRFLKIEESDDITRRPLRVDGDGAELPAGDGYHTRLHRPTHVSAGDAAQLLTRFVSADGDVTAYAPSNLLIITDTGQNLRRLLRLLEVIDVARTGRQIWIEPLHHADASHLAEVLSDVLAEPPAAAQSATNASPRRATPGSANDRTEVAPGPIGTASVEAETRVLGDERTNSLIILATEPSYLRVLSLLAALDVPLPEGGGAHVYRVQHGDADELAETLSSMTGSASGRGRQGTTQGEPSLVTGQVSVRAHAANNALIITASLHDYATLRTVLADLDTPRRQVFIEAVIMELTSKGAERRELGLLGGLPDTPASGALSAIEVNPVDGDALTGLALGIRGPTIPAAQQLGLSVPEFGVTLQALSQSGDTNILSTPHILTLDNEEAEISVGQNVPLQTGLGGGGVGNLSTLMALANGQQDATEAGSDLLSQVASGATGSIPRQDVGTSIRITPHVNDSGQIRLEIAQEISEAGSDGEGALGVRSVSKRTATTQLVVSDAQTVVIGGLLRDMTDEQESGIPILGDLPLIGALFRNTVRRTEKTNLLLILTPYIIRDGADLRAIYERKMRERQDFIDRYFVFADDEYQPPMDYSRTQGLVGEIVAELDRDDEQRRQAEAAERQPPPPHQPRAPIEAFGAPDIVSTASPQTEP